MRPTYTVVWTRKAARMFEELPREVQSRFIDQVESIADEPFAHVRKVEGSPATVSGSTSIGSCSRSPPRT